jgi:16S rRNA (uracil1498-N3)-methyltransferase
MRVPRIYTGQPLRSGTHIELEAGASQHVASALRMQVGDALVLFDGRGGEYRARIDSISKKSVTVVTTEHLGRELESPLAIHLGIAVSRGDRMDWVVQKSTELGVREITPLFTERTEVRLAADRAAKKLQHWRQVAVSACEQCGRNTLPSIHELTNLADWITATDADCRLVLHHRSEGPTLPDAAPHKVDLLIGPEGGLSEAEIEAAESAGYFSLALGPRVMRTETAPLAAMAILQAKWGDMGTP